MPKVNRCTVCGNPIGLIRNQCEYCFPTKCPEDKCLIWSGVEGECSIDIDCEAPCRLDNRLDNLCLRTNMNSKMTVRMTAKIIKF